MKRYRIIDGTPVLPPQNTVDKEGHVVSNFAGRVFKDASFAAKHGYHPLAAEMPSEELLEGETSMPVYSLQNGKWMRHANQKKEKDPT